MLCFSEAHSIYTEAEMRILRMTTVLAVIVFSGCAASYAPSAAYRAGGAVDCSWYRQAYAVSDAMYKVLTLGAGPSIGGSLEQICQSRGYAAPKPPQP